MPRRFRRARERPAASGAEAFEIAVSPGPARLDSDGEAPTLAQRKTAEIEGEGRLAAASGPSGNGKPAVGELGDWRDRFDTVEELYDRFVNVDRLRGRLAREVGKLRRQLRLAAQLDELASKTVDPYAGLYLAEARRFVLNPAAAEQVLEPVERMVAVEEGASAEEPLGA